MKPGSYHGVVLARRELDSCVMTEDRYEPHSVIPSHTHSWPTVTVTLNGHFDEIVGGALTRCPAGAVIFRPPGTTHSDVVSRRPTRLFNIELEPSSYVHLSAGNRRGLLLDGKPAGLAVEIQRAMSTGGSSRPSLEELTSRLAEAILERARTSAPETSEPAWLAAADLMINERFRQNIDLAAMASEIDIHPVHLSRTHRRFRGETIGARVARKRVNEATRLLLDERLPLALIALEAGFTDQSHMNRTFRAVTGATPGTFRAAGEPGRS